ncbi:hypothetical protein Hypma_007301 [Hypsizygus marmoreus]|uniref:BTB domain-containing protein n=1 Tax=Hypsizygus marmoreus TaxID=39966 RepID=A0A369KC76_HYPMA|nr:hypothetical protein Hypma_007301 [Hypsizygus marmoreus]
MSKELDFPNGDIILAIPTRRYRVYKKTLIAASDVFANLFAVALPASPDAKQPKIEKAAEAVPVIDMQDEEKPFTLFLHALYDHDLDPYIPKLSRKTTNIISHVLDIVDKYNVSQSAMRAKFLPYMNRDWPATLAEWDANEAYIRELKISLEAEQEEPQELDDRLPEPACTIRFAYTYALSEAAIQHIPEYIPAAFYHLSRLPPFADTKSPTLNGGDFWDIDGLRTANRSLLRHRDMMCLLHGMNRLRLEAARIAFEGFFEEADGDNFASGTEKAAMTNWWRKVGIQRLLGPHDMPDLIGFLKLLIDALGKDTSSEVSNLLRKETSAEYRQRMQTYLTKEREEIWNALGYHFSLYAFFYS